MNDIELIARAKTRREAIAFEAGGKTWTYGQLLNRSATIAAALLDDADDLNESRVGFLVPAGFDYAATQWGIWRAGGVTVPLCLSATLPEWEYALTDARISKVVVADDWHGKVAPLCEDRGIRLIRLDAIAETSNRRLPAITSDRRAMILYTSGTTNRPKGVVTTHANIRAQIVSLTEAWEWQPTDRIPLFLPLHHIHGIVNVMSCALWIGAVIEPFARFDLETILKRVKADAYTVFMAVPTIYVKLIQALDAMPAKERATVCEAFGRMRLMISGSAALPASVHEKWTELTGQELLERYGMTEIGMALSNPFHGERRPGAVGVPLPGVETRLQAENGEVVIGEGAPGEIQVRGPAVFKEYWNRPDVTRESFEDGWFRTGDMAVIEGGYFRIMGRLSGDIIKSGGYKLSALEIEATLLQHDTIRECAVVGVADDTWGEAVAAAIVPEPGAADLNLETLRDWCRDRLSVYKIPKRLLILDALPRNAMGKVTKPAVADLF